ncbi:hydantoinase/oxoprolinase family protein [Chelatococcus asaccharovorans]|uniref:N-methylhydantoinase A n=1 Tax=Chelatococcus asaccharovorans TaxID=28210 RepID=A0A2V3U853_9HYPH|nr:hydantoinase/oxoprolinase family protein [Chelatococcus asaccharovorans]MBS7705621.1 hydantoinase/oxoprolinase family protein [Chelatococcus asaccharovorans]PXW59966.1 N-methylhydantoinase A [Chelatococcus asaccharovorans]
MSQNSYRIGVDIGGTFTDVVVARDDGLIETRKVPSTPDDYSRGIAMAIKALVEEFQTTPDRITGIVHATTVATNAILEYKGACTGLLTTAGFRDVLEMRRLRIPVLYDLQYDKPKPLVARRLRLEVRERLSADGGVRLPLSEDDVVAAARQFREGGAEAVAVSFLHAYANPAHEIAAEEILRRELGPDVYICRGSEILPEIREYERTSTAVVNAYIGPVVRNYASALTARLASIGVTCAVDMMHSGGGIMRLESAVRRAASLVESGPAAGVIACARLFPGRDEPSIISFDMGGTTAKAALVEDGEPARTTEYEVGAGINLSSKLVKGGGYPIKMPFIDVSEIGAGGGSLIGIDRMNQVSVGPQSAGAWPGPVCYGLGGKQATLTDAFLTLGYINDEALAGGTFPLQAEAGRAALNDQVARPLGLELSRTARGVLTLAVTTMTRAVKAVSTYRGRDPRQSTLIAFGGNGPVVATEVAMALGIRRVIIPRAAGVFSALGLLRSDVEQEFVRPSRHRAGELDDAGLAALFEELAADARRIMTLEGYDQSGATFHRAADLRYVGQAYELTVPAERLALEELTELFHREHERTYGHRSQGDTVHLVNARLTVRLPLVAPPPQFHPDRPLRRADRRVVFAADCAPATVAVIGRGELDATPRRGPFVVEDYDSTAIIGPGQAASLDAAGNIVIALSGEAA